MANEERLNIGLDALAGAITESVLRAVNTKIDLKAKLEASGGLIWRPYITAGGMLAIFKSADLGRVLAGDLTAGQQIAASAEE
jgi:hypothetical protein